MKIETITIHGYEIPLTNGLKRAGILINITDEMDHNGWGEVAPLPNWSQETLEDALQQIHKKKEEIKKIHWTAHTWLQEIIKLELLPSVEFGLESALLSILIPLSEQIVPASALLMGSPQEIIEQAELRHNEGYISAKLKVSNLGLKDASQIIRQLKDKFRLRVDVNRAWNTLDSLRFFEQFPLDSFDYVEEPFQNADDLKLFVHPLAIDESFPKDLSLEQLNSLPALKALIYKPTIQGGISSCLPLYEWTARRGIDLILSSCFESDLGLAHIASMGQRLSLSAPVGIGTYYHLNKQICSIPLQFSQSYANLPARLIPKLELIHLIENKDLTMNGL